METATDTTYPTRVWPACCSAWTARWASTAACSEHGAAAPNSSLGFFAVKQNIFCTQRAKYFPRAASPQSQTSPYNDIVCGACWALYFLEPMLIEPGLGTSLGERDRLASDEPNIKLTSPT